MIIVTHHPHNLAQCMTQASAFKRPMGHVLRSTGFRLPRGGPSGFSRGSLAAQRSWCLLGACFLLGLLGAIALSFVVTYMF